MIVLTIKKLFVDIRMDLFINIAEFFVWNTLQTSMSKWEWKKDYHPYKGSHFCLTVDTLWHVGL